MVDHNLRKNVIYILIENLNYLILPKFSVAINSIT
jgi:hypothetical protein